MDIEKFRKRISNGWDLSQSRITNELLLEIVLELKKLNRRRNDGS